MLTRIDRRLYGSVHVGSIDQRVDAERPGGAGDRPEVLRVVQPLEHRQAGAAGRRRPRATAGGPPVGRRRPHLGAGRTRRRSAITSVSATYTGTPRSPSDWRAGSRSARRATARAAPSGSRGRIRSAGRSATKPSAMNSSSPSNAPPERLVVERPVVVEARIVGVAVTGGRSVTRSVNERRPGESSANDLNSRALPDGSRRNIVDCSPTSPAKRVCGSMTNSTPAARRRSASGRPVRGFEQHAEVGHRHVVRRRPRCGSMSGARRHRPDAVVEVGDELVAVEVEVDPRRRRPTLRATEDVAVERAERRRGRGPASPGGSGARVGCSQREGVRALGGRGRLVGSVVAPHVDASRRRCAARPIRASPWPTAPSPVPDGGSGSTARR